MPGGRLLNHWITRQDNLHPGLQAPRFHRPVRVPRRRADRLGRDRRGHGGPRPGGPARREPAGALRPHAGRVVRQPGRGLGRGGGRGRTRHGQGVGSLHGRLEVVLRPQQIELHQVLATRTTTGGGSPATRWRAQFGF